MLRFALATLAVLAFTSCLEDPSELRTDGPVGSETVGQYSGDSADGGQAATWDLVRVIDGDTIVAHYHGTDERIRFIGIDTPETGECGFQEATDRVVELTAGGQVTLTPGASEDRDIYERPLRYVEVGDVDVGLTLIEEGLAVARYDSRDGWGPHPREDRYRQADAATPHVCE